MSQAPSAFSYQGVALDTKGAPVSSKQISLRITILQGSVSGIEVYKETHTPTTDIYGQFSVVIGQGAPLLGTMSAIKWGSNSHFLKTEIDIAGGSTYINAGTTQLLSVPYALYAEFSGASGSVGYQHHDIGEYFGGGVVFHVYKGIDGVEHGLIISTVNQSDSLETWSNVDLPLGVPPLIQDGLINTKAIIAQPGHVSSAALLCTQFQGGGYNDWYLPSMEEFTLIYANRFSINLTLSQIPNSNSIFDISQVTTPKDCYSKYWTSTENWEPPNIYFGTRTWSNSGDVYTVYQNPFQSVGDTPYVEWIFPISKGFLPKILPAGYTAGGFRIPAVRAIRKF